MNAWVRAAVVAVAMACTSLAAAQAGDGVVRGVVVDSASGEAVPGAIVSLADGSAAIADAAGRFELAVPASGPVTLSVEAQGYASLRVDVADPAAPVTLTVTAEQGGSGGEVVVIEGRAPNVAKPRSYDIGAEELRTLPGSGNDALKSLQSLPGVSRVPYGAGGLVLRGSSPRDTNVVLDGVEVPILYHFGGLASFYPTSLLSSIELQPGGFGAEFGRAQGGLVELTSRPGRADKWRVESEASLIDAAVRADGPGTGGGTWTFGLRRSYVDAVLALALPSDSSLKFTAAPRYFDGQVRYDLAVGRRDQVSVMLFGSDDRMTLVIDDDEDGDFDGRRDDEFFLRQRFVRVAARWRRTIAKDAVLTVTPWVGFDQSEVRIDSDGLRRSTVPLGLRIDATRTFRAGAISGGIDAQGGRYDLTLNNEPPPMPGADDPADIERDTRDLSGDVGFWLQGTYRIAGDRVAVRPGVRLDHFGFADEWVVDPRLTVSHRFGAGITLTESLGVYHQPPLQSDADYGNPDLTSSYAVQGSIGLTAALPWGVDASLTGFSEESKRLAVDVVSSASPASEGGSAGSGGAAAASAQFLEEQFGTWAYKGNVGRGRAYGTELLVKRAGERAYGWLAYTYSRSLRRGDPLRFLDYAPYVLDQPHVLTALGSTRLGAHWRLGARLRFASGNPYTPVADTYFDTDRQRFQPIDGPLLSARLPDFFQLDLRVDRVWRRDWGQVSAFLDVQNVTNRANPESVQYSDDYRDIQLVRGLPIFPSIGVEYRP